MFPSKNIVVMLSARIPPSHAAPCCTLICLPRPSPVSLPRWRLTDSVFAFYTTSGFDKCVRELLPVSAHKRLTLPKANAPLLIYKMAPVIPIHSNLNVELLRHRFRFEVQCFIVPHNSLARGNRTSCNGRDATLESVDFQWSKLIACKVLNLTHVPNYSLFTKYFLLRFTGDRLLHSTRFTMSITSKYHLLNKTVCAT